MDGSLWSFIFIDPFSMHFIFYFSCYSLTVYTHFLQNICRKNLRIKIWCIALEKECFRDGLYHFFAFFPAFAFFLAFWLNYHPPIHFLDFYISLAHSNFPSCSVSPFLCRFIHFNLFIMVKDKWCGIVSRFVVGR